MLVVLVHGASAASTLVAGAVFGFVVWSVMHGIVVSRLLETAPRFDWTAIALHVLFGVATAGSLVVARLRGRASGWRRGLTPGADVTAGHRGVLPALWPR